MKVNVNEKSYFQACAMLEIKHLPESSYVAAATVKSCYLSEAICDSNLMYAVQNYCCLHSIDPKIPEQPDKLSLAVVCKTQKQLKLFYLWNWYPTMCQL